jgi:predicted alpha/beta superfamily hydrolase
LKEIEYKFTLGSWEKVECSANGSDIQNRKSVIKPGDTILVTIEDWKRGIKKHTASSNVSIVKEDFYIPQLKRNRRIWIYLPPDYTTSKRSYPVFYAHDGQNLFDAATSFSGEWGVDECLDSLFKTNSKSAIIVGIDNGGAYRIEELTPWPNSKYGGGKAALYADFIVNTLKPYIDSAYRTLPGRKNTGVFGSSLGGLVSFYMVLKYPETFGKAGVFSPSFWFSDKVYEMAEHFKPKKSLKMFIIAGRNEDENLEKEILKMKKILENSGFNKNNLKVELIPDGQHNEWFWQREFSEVYSWLSK